MSKVVEALANTAGLSDIYSKVMDEQRLSFQDGVRLYESRELMAVGAMANIVRERKNGDAAFFVRNMHLNPTNVCTVDCKFCGFYRPYRNKEEGWTWDLERCLREVRNRLDEPLTEVHIVGGHNLVVDGGQTRGSGQFLDDPGHSAQTPRKKQAKKQS